MSLEDLCGIFREYSEKHNIFHLFKGDKYCGALLLDGFAIFITLFVWRNANTRIANIANVVVRIMRGESYASVHVSEDKQKETTAKTYRIK